MTEYLLKNGKIADGANGIDPQKLDATERSKLSAVLRKSEAGSRLNGDDLRILATARRATGIRAKSTGTTTDNAGNAAEALRRALNTLKGVKNG